MSSSIIIYGKTEIRCEPSTLEDALGDIKTDIKLHFWLGGGADEDGLYVQATSQSSGIYEITVTGPLELARKTRVADYLGTLGYTQTPTLQ